MQRLKPEDLTQYQFLSALRISPEGRSAALCVSQANRKTNAYDTALWKLDIRSGQMECLPCRQPQSWCYRDEHTILFTNPGTEEDQRRRREGERLTVISSFSLRTGREEVLCRVPLENAAIEMLAGDCILLRSFHDNRRPDFESMPPEARRAALAEYAREEEWEVCEESPFRRDGRGIVEKKRSRLFLCRLPSGEMEPLTDPWFDTLLCQVDGTGTKIAAVGETFTRRMSRMKGIWLYDLQTGEKRQLLPERGYQVSDAAFMGGGLMVCATPWDGFGPFPNHDLYRIDLASGEMRCVYRHTAEDCGFKTSSDCRLQGGRCMAVAGDTLYYITSYDNSTGINCWREGEEVRRCTAVGFNPECIAASGENLLAVGFLDGKPQELYRVENGQAERQSRFHAAFLEAHTPVKPQPVSFVNKDGVRIDGFVIYPAAYQEGQKYPGVLQIHGGPRSAYSDSYSHEMQVLASHGCFVFFCNPRGSASRGEAFAALGDRRGTVDFEDLMAFTDYVASICPGLDPDRLGVTGISYGGFMTNWIIGHTTRFRAAVSCCSIANNLSFFGDSDENNWGSLLAPWDNPEKGGDGSPLKYYREVTTPTLFIQTDEDYRCPLSEAVQMYTALQIRGIASKLCIFHGDSHSLSRTGHPRNRVRRLQALLSWMDQYLKLEKEASCNRD